MNSSEHSHSHNTETSGCVIVIDDNAGVRQMLALALETTGFEVLEAGTELELQRLLAQRRPDALLIDLQRAETDGLHLLVRMRSRANLRDVPLLFLAGTDDPGLREHAVLGGADWFGVRPLGMIELQDRVIQLVGRRRRVVEPVRRHKRVS
jgi:DNA-binding response OmpR family regulator